MITLYVPKFFNKKWEYQRMVLYVGKKKKNVGIYIVDIIARAKIEPQIAS